MKGTYTSMSELTAAFARKPKSWQIINPDRNSTKNSWSTTVGPNACLKIVPIPSSLEKMLAYDAAHLTFDAYTHADSPKSNATYGAPVERLLVLHNDRRLRQAGSGKFEDQSE